MKTLRTVLKTATLLFFVAAGFAVAAGDSPGVFTNPIAFNSLADFLKKLLEVIVDIAFPIIVLAIIYTGYLFVAAQGRPEELKKAKTALVWTLIGGMLILGAFVLSAAIKGTVEDIESGAAYLEGAALL